MGKPIKIGDTEKKKLLDYLQNEMELAEREVLYPLQQKREEWDDCYYGKVAPRSEAWMSNFPVQLGATFTDAIQARLMNTIWAYRPFISIRPTHDSGWTQVAKKVENFVDFKVHTEMKMYREMRKALFECCRLGTGAMLTPWVQKKERVMMRRLWWKTETEIETVNGCVVKYLPIRDLLYPGGYSELEDLPWWSRRMRWSELQLRKLKAGKTYGDVDKVLKYLESPDAAELEARRRAGEEPAQSRVVIGWQPWFEYDLKGNGEYRRYTAHVHLPSMTLMRLEEDNYPRWPLTLLRYGPRDYGLCGLGVVEMTKPYDDGLYGLYNLLVDNFKIATMVCLKGRKGTNLTNKTKIYPGKLFLLNDPERDLMPMMLGQAFNLNPAFVRMIWELGERRAGVSDYALGRESAQARRPTATGTLALIQEGQRRFDLTIRDIRYALDDFGMFYLTMMHQRLPARIPYMIMGKDGAYIQQFLDVPNVPPYQSLAVRCSLSNVATNKEIEKSTAMQTYALLAQYYERVIQLAMMQANPQVPDSVKMVTGRIMEAAAEKTKRVLETHGELAPEVFTDVTGPPEEELPPGGPSAEPLPGEEEPVG